MRFTKIFGAITTDDIIFIICWKGTETASSSLICDGVFLTSALLVEVPDLITIAAAGRLSGRKIFFFWSTNYQVLQEIVDVPRWIYFTTQNQGVVSWKVHHVIEDGHWSSTYLKCLQYLLFFYNTISGMVFMIFIDQIRIVVHGAH